MAWDFQTDPDFQEHLDWMRDLIDTEIIPLEPVLPHLTREESTAIRDVLRERVKARGLWGAFLDEELGGLGWGQLKLALMSEQVGRSMWSMGVFGTQAPDSGNMELLAHGATDEHGVRAAVDPVHVHDFHATILHLMGLDHTRLTYRHAGRDFRLTDVHGELVRGVLA